MLFMLATLVGHPAVTSPRTGFVGPAPVIQVSLNNDGNYVLGGQVSVRVQTDADGYLTVFRVNGDGQIQVLFPLDPDGDSFVRGGKEYEIRGRGENASFMADNQPGNGMVYAALSHQPYSFGDFAVNGHWDYQNLRLRDSSSDPENDLNEIVSQMTSHAHFDYDALGYRVADPGYVTTAAAPNTGYYSGLYDPYYDPAWRCMGCGWGYPGSEFSIGLGYSYDPWLYSPWIYNSTYPYGYGYGYVGRGYGYGSGRGYPVFVNPRGRVPEGTRARPRVEGNQPPRGYNPSGSYGRPQPGNVVTRTAPDTRAPAPQPTATRARPRPADLTESPRAGSPYVRPALREPPADGNSGQRVRPESQNQRPVYREPPRVERAPSPPAPAPAARTAPPESHGAPPAHSAPPARSRPEPAHGGGRRP
jgi:hypothetical protein